MKETIDIMIDSLDNAQAVLDDTLEAITPKCDMCEKVECSCDSDYEDYVEYNRE